MPPADVLVAATVIAGQPLTRALEITAAGGDDRNAGITPAHLQRQVDALRAAVIELYGRLGYSLPPLDADVHDSDAASRAASAG